jgi:hypothetical protein
MVAGSRLAKHIFPLISRHLLVALGHRKISEHIMTNQTKANVIPTREHIDLLPEHSEPRQR